MILDIQFWNNRKSLEGLSVRSVFFNVFQSLIVLLYVLDNETNTLIKISCFVGLCIEIWKINKVIDVSIDPENTFLGFFPKLIFKDKGSYENSGTNNNWGTRFIFFMQCFQNSQWFITNSEILGLVFVTKISCLWKIRNSFKLRDFREFSKNWGKSPIFTQKFFNISLI